MRPWRNWKKKGPQVIRPKPERFQSVTPAPSPGQPYRHFRFPRSQVIRVTGPPYNNVVDIAITNARTQVTVSEGKGGAVNVE